MTWLGKEREHLHLLLAAVLLFGGSGRRRGVLAGGGRLLDPPGRGSLWREGVPSHQDYDDHRLNCGGVAQQWRRWGGRCGSCGDGYGQPRPRPHELGGEFGEGIISRKYTQHQVYKCLLHI